MLCDKCKQREANIHIQQSINGVTTERNLCSECASKEPGLMNAFSVDGFFGDLFETSLLKRGSGRLGNMFDITGLSGGIPAAPRDRKSLEFEDVGGPSASGIELPEIKINRENTTAKQPTSRVQDLKEQLKAAIEAENFEKAAELRDRIKQNKEKGKDEKTKG